METITYDVRDRIATIILNRPDKLNAINAQLREELFTAFEDAERREDVWTILRRGPGRLRREATDRLAGPLTTRAT